MIVYEFRCRLNVFILINIIKISEILFMIKNKIYYRLVILTCFFRIFLALFQHVFSMWFRIVISRVIPIVICVSKVQNVYLLHEIGIF